MNRQVDAIAGRLSLRSPQRRSLEILDRITDLVMTLARLTQSGLAL